MAYSKREEWLQMTMYISRRKNKIRKTREDKIVDVIVYVISAIVFVVAFYPFFLAIVMAFNQGNDSMRGGIYFWPRKPTLENFKQILTDPSWGQAFFITLLRTIVGTFITVMCTSIMAYGLSARNLVGRKFYMMLLIVAMYFSGGVIPYYVVLRTLKLLNSFWVYIIPGAINLFYVLVSINFYQDIPMELAESARIDGASELKIFIRIILPVAKPLLATIAIFTAVGHWNSWYDSVYFNSKKELRTLGHMLMTVVNRVSAQDVDEYGAAYLASEAASVTSYSIQLAAMAVAVAPILCIYPFFQRYFVSGLTLGSVKG